MFKKFTQELIAINRGNLKHCHPLLFFKDNINLLVADQ